MPSLVRSHGASHRLFIFLAVFITATVADQCQTRCGLTCGSLQKCEVTTFDCTCSTDVSKVVGIVLGIFGAVTVIGWLRKKFSEPSSSDSNNVDAAQQLAYERSAERAVELAERAATAAAEAAAAANSTAPPPPPSKNTLNAVNFCVQCGKDRPPGSCFCPGCGAAF